MTSEIAKVNIGSNSHSTIGISLPNLHISATLNFGDAKLLKNTY